MNKYFLILLLTIFIVSCESSKNNTNKPTNNATKDTVIAVRDTVRIYLNRMLNTDVVRFEQRLLDSMYYYYLYKNKAQRKVLTIIGIIGLIMNS